MKRQNNFSMRYNCYRNYTLFSFFIGLILLLTSCTGKPEPYSILEIAGEGELFNNYSKSFMMTLYQPDSITPTAITGSITQDEFNSFINSHPDIEIIEMIENDTIGSLKALSGLNKLYGLTITDSVTDLESVENLTNLKYLSLPYKLVDDSVNFAQLKKSLPDTRIVANEEFCLGSGWLLLIIPFVFIIRFFCRYGKQDLVPVAPRYKYISTIAPYFRNYSSIDRLY